VGAGRLDGRTVAWAWFIQAQLDIIFNKYHQAKAALQQALAITAGDPLLTAMCTEAMGSVHQVLDTLPKARQLYLEALIIHRSLKNIRGEANCVLALGNLHLQLEELPQAKSQYLETLPIYRKIRHSLGEANCILSMGQLHLKLGELPQALEQHRKAKNIYESIREPLGKAHCIKSMGDVAIEQGDSNAALHYLTVASEHYEALGILAEKAKCYCTLGNYLCNLRQYSKSIEAYNNAIEIFPEVISFTNRSEPHMYLGNFPTAQQDLDAARAFNNDFFYLHFNQGRLALWQGQAKTALDHIDQALIQRPEYGEFHLWRAVTLSVNGLAWKETLHAGLARTHVIRRINEVIHGLASLAQNL
jgi:tetratricopeptide (TPR) repeat protein